MATIRQIVNFKLLWVPLCLLLFTNVYMQNMVGFGITNFADWDNHQLSFMSSHKGALGANNAVDSFQTYGPFFRHLSVHMDPFKESTTYFWKFTLLLLMACILCLFILQLELPCGPLVLCIFFLLYNFPNISYAPFILVLWSLALPYRSGLQILHLLLGVATSAILYMYKPSWGILGLGQMILTGLCHPHLQGWLNKSCYVLSTLATYFPAITFLYFISAESGNTISLFKFLIISIQDTQTYSQIMSFPLKKGQHAWMTFFPLVVLLVLILLTFFKVEGKRVWLGILPLAIIFGEYKHSYTRADITNLKGIVWFIPLLLFFILLRYWKNRNLRITCMTLLVFFTLTSFMHWTPYNVPWRHSREWWLHTPEYLRTHEAQCKTVATNSFNDFIKGFEWLNPHGIEGTLLSIPGQILLSSLGSKPYQLPSNQTYYATGLRLELDIQKLQLDPPDHVLLQNFPFDQRMPLDNHPALLTSLASHGRLLEKHGDYFLLSYEKPRYQLHAKSLGLHEMRGGKYSIQFEAPRGCFIRMKCTGLTDSPWYGMRSALIRGEKILLTMKSEGKENNFNCPYTLLESGTIMTTDLEAHFRNDRKNVMHLIQFNGSLLDRFPADPAHYWPMSDNIAMLEFEMLTYTPVP